MYQNPFRTPPEGDRHRRAADLRRDHFVVVRAEHFRDSRPFGIAGIWDAWGDEEPVYSACMLTTEANETVRLLHDRMPVILSPEDHETWLNLDSKVEDLLPLLRPLPADDFDGFEVRTLVNKVANAGPELIEPS